MDRLAAEQQEREERHGDRDVGDDRARERCVDRDIEQLGHRHLLVAPQHLADTIVDDDRVVERIAENREQRRDAGEIEIDLRHRHEPEREHDVVHVGDHGAQRELPFEAKP